MRTGSQSLKIFAVALVLCVLWNMALGRLPKPELGETNYTANRLRIERFLDSPNPECVIVGTSIAGRLIPSYFEGSGLTNIVNLGLDGASPITGLQLALRKTNSPKVILLEAHRLWNPTRANDTQLISLSEGMDRRLHRSVTVTKSESRPTSVLYSWLRSRQSTVGTPQSGKPQTSNVTEESKIAQIPKELRESIQALQARGTEVVLLRMPVGREDPADPKFQDDVDRLVRYLGLPSIDLYRKSIHLGDPIRYSDGLHLAPESARRLATLLAEQVQQFLKKNR